MATEKLEADFKHWPESGTDGSALVSVSNDGSHKVQVSYIQRAYQHALAQRIFKHSGRNSRIHAAACAHVPGTAAILMNL